MNIQQVSNLKKIMGQFGGDYQLAEQILSRHNELDDAVTISATSQVFDVLTAPMLAVRRDVLEAAKDDIEFQETAAAMIRELTGIIARYDIADQIDSARDAA